MSQEIAMKTEGAEDIYENLFGKRLLSVEEAARYLGIAPRTIYNKTGRRAKVKFPVKPKRVGGSLRFDIKDLERYVESL
jgi:predicted DNA-binding transcriptional regulator AlpA